MAAVDYNSLNALCENLKFQIQDVLGLEIIVAAISAEQVLNPSWLVEDRNQDDRNAWLKKLTGCVIATGTNLNCYPIGFDDTLCFDLSGDEVVP
jgi:hypothetical protein